jgi:exopolysaccharide biosynthesis polyprenyl glycosylphosphotransferase
MVAVSTSLLSVAIYSFNLSYLGIKFLFVFAVFNLFLSFSFKLLVYKYLKNVRKKGLNQLNILVIGDNTAVSFLRQIFHHPEWGYRVIAFIVSPIELGDLAHKFPFLAKDTDIEQLLRDKAIDEVILLKDKTGQSEVEDLVQVCSDVGVVFRMYSPFYNMLANKTHVQYFGTLPMLTISSKPINYINLKIKRIIDVVFSSMAIVFLLPLFFIIGIVIKSDSKGPIFFRQKRVGLRGRKFVVFKFRTMVINANELRRELEKHNEMDGPVFKISKDPRITRVGRFLRKTSLDELPQFFNVFMGDMSVVGPRPPLPEEVKKYERWQLRRLSMKPGITCIWQVSGRNSVPFEEWMKMDMQYIDNWSLKLDFVISLKTIRAILRAEGQ